MAISRRGVRARGAGIAVLVLVGSLLLPIALIAAWTRTTIADTDGYVAAMTRLGESDEFRRALVDEVEQAALDQIDVDHLVDAALEALAGEDALNPVARRVLASSTEFAIRSIVRSVSDRAVNSDSFQAVWNGANRGAHAGLLVVLRGSGGDILEMDPSGVVTANLEPLLNVLGAELESSGLAAFNVRTLEEVRIPLFTNAGLATIRSHYVLLDRVASWLPAVVLLAFAGGLVLTRSRIRVLLWMGGLISVSTGATLVVIRLVRNDYLAQSDAPGARGQVLTRVADTLTSQLSVALVPALVVAVVALVIAGLAAFLRGQYPERSGGSGYWPGNR